jgi:hypothetical protein
VCAKALYWEQGVQFGFSPEGKQTYWLTAEKFDNRNKLFNTEHMPIITSCTLKKCNC